MWKLIGLFSLFLALLSTARELEEQLTLKVEVKDLVRLEKPPFNPPEKLSYRVRYPEERKLLAKLLEPPKELEEAELFVPKEGGCGAPKELNLYREAVLAYRKGNYFTAEEKLKSLVALEGPYAKAGKYLLGLVYYKKGKKEDALELFRRACQEPSIYREPACESFYALYFQLYREPYPAQEPALWRKVYRIAKEGVVPSERLRCNRYTFKKYCRYVEDFSEGRVNLHYRASTEIRRALALYYAGRLDEAKKILEKYKDALLPYRDVVLYYLALIELKQGNEERALDLALLLETVNEELARNLYTLIVVKRPELAPYVYQKTGEKWVLHYAGVKAYNEGDYERALRYFEKAGSYLYAAYAALKLGKLEKAYELLKRVERKNAAYYRTLLEVLYALNREEEFLKLLEEVAQKYPQLYKEYYGWYLFKKGRWEEAVNYFDEPYYKAVALFNARKYEQVLELLKDDDSLEARLLKARAALAMGKPALARKFLFRETPEELYLEGLSYFVEGRYEKAAELFSKLTSHEKLGIKATLKLADAYYNMGKKEQARVLYRTVVEKAAGSKEAREALVALAQIQAEEPTKDLERFIREFERTNPDSPLLPELKLKLAELYAKEGRTLEAEIVLRKLVNDPEYRERALLLLAQVTQNPQEREKILLRLLRSKDASVRKEAFEQLTRFYRETGNELKLARLLERRGFKEALKAVELYLRLGRVKDAERLFNRLYEQNPEDEELKELALKLYEKTGKLKYLKIAYASKRPEVALKAAYLLGNYYAGKDDKKALEYLLEVVYSEERSLPFYKRAVFTAVELLLKLGARKDASCVLKKLEGLTLEPWEEEKVLKLKRELPPCEV
ncbi:MAG: tetratricopeptide repeat protein [Aquificae bacterium]|nr:tetratricopeptide repeat protein [Aquificota bacterium]